MALIRSYPEVHEAYLGLSMWFTAEASKVLTPYLSPGQTLVLLGSSGTGKSTLTNSLLGSATQDTGGVREHDSRGKHTSTARSLHLLPTGACVIDTPGVRTLRPDVDAQTLSALFEDVSTPMPRRVVFETAVIRTSPAAWCR